MAIDMEIAKWKPFKDALRKPEKDMFEDMLLRSKLFASAGGMAVRPVVLEAMFMSILLDHHKRLLELDVELEKLKASGKPKGHRDISKWQTTIAETAQLQGTS